MSDEKLLRADGLSTSPNSLSEVPEGALAFAENIILRRRSVIEPRFGLLSGGTLANTIHALKRYQQYTVAAHGLSSSGTTNLARHDGTSWTAYATSFNRITDARPVFSESNDCLYFTSGVGVQRLDSLTGEPVIAGAVKSTSFDRLVSSPVAVTDYPRFTGAGGFLTDQYQTAYRFAIGFIDAAKQTHIGVPSGRIIVKNQTGTYGYAASTTQKVVVRCLLPKMPGTASTSLSTSYFIQLYRSKQISVNAVNYPSDEMYQVYEKFLTSTDITNGYVEIEDERPDSMLGDAAYWNPSRDTLAGGNEMPPLCYDICNFNGTMFFARTWDKHRIYIDLLGLDAANGLQNGDTITINGTAYTATTGVPAAGQFKIEPAGPSVAERIERTAFNLVAAINKYASNTDHYAYYISSPEESPGKMMFERRVHTSSSFVVIASRSTCWNPPLPSAGTLTESTADAWTNGVMWSKLQQPEHVPVANRSKVGGAGAIRKMIALRNVMYIFKDDGLCRCTSDGRGGFIFSEFDQTVKIVSPDTVQVVANKIYALCEGGVVEIGESGIQRVSYPIEKDINDAMKAIEGTNGVVNNLRYRPFAVGHERLKCYILCMPSTSHDGSSISGLRSEFAYVYFPQFKAWTKFTSFRFNCGEYNQEEDTSIFGEAVFGAGTANFYEETPNSYTDPGLVGFTCKFGWTVHTAGRPSETKRFIEATLLLESPTFQNVNATFSTNVTTSPTTVTSTNVTAYDHRIPVPRAYGRASRLNMFFTVDVSSTVGFTALGCVLKYHDGSRKSGK